MELRKKLTILRENKDMSKAQVARLLNLPRTTYSNYELGVASPDLAIIYRIADLYKVSIDYLICDKPNSRWLVPESINTFEEAKVFLEVLSLGFLVEEHTPQKILALAKIIVLAINGLIKN